MDRWRRLDARQLHRQAWRRPVELSRSLCRWDAQEQNLHLPHNYLRICPLPFTKFQLFLWLWALGWLKWEFLNWKFCTFLLFASCYFYLFLSGNWTFLGNKQVGIRLDCLGKQTSWIIFVLVVFFLQFFTFPICFSCGGSEIKKKKLLQKTLKFQLIFFRLNKPYNYRMKKIKII